MIYHHNLMIFGNIEDYIVTVHVIIYSELKGKLSRTPSGQFTVCGSFSFGCRCLNDSNSYSLIVKKKICSIAPALQVFTFCISNFMKNITPSVWEGKKLKVGSKSCKMC